MVTSFPRLSRSTIETLLLAFTGTDTFTRVPELKLIDALTNPNLTERVLDKLVPLRERDAFCAAANGVKLDAVGFW